MSLLPMLSPLVPNIHIRLLTLILAAAVGVALSAGTASAQSTPKTQAKALDQAGLKASQQGNLRQALQDFQRATQVSPSYAPAWLHEGNYPRRTTTLR